MKRLFLLSVLCLLVLGISAQTAKEEIFADVHRSAANYYAYPAVTAVQTAPPAGYKPFYLSHYARHGSRFLIDPDDYEQPLEVMREADRNGVLTGLGKKRFVYLTACRVWQKEDMVNLLRWVHVSTGELLKGCTRIFPKSLKDRLRLMHVPQWLYAVFYP